MHRPGIEIRQIVRPKHRPVGDGVYIKQVHFDFTWEELGQTNFGNSCAPSVKLSNNLNTTISSYSCLQRTEVE
jgi:hypothetical protein